MVVPKIELNDSRDWQVIGENSTGRVYSAVWKRQQTDDEEKQQRSVSIKVAVKVVHGTADLNESENKHLRKFQKDTEFMMKLEHKNVISFFGFTKQNESSNIGLVMELAEGGSLYQIIHNKDRDYSVGEALSWMCEAVDGIIYLHSQEVILRYLKSTNLLIVPSGNSITIKVANFGLRCYSWRSTVLQCLKLDDQPLAYLSPEVIQSNNCEQKCDNRCDVYSFGVILWEVIARRKPYERFDSVVKTMAAIFVYGERPEPKLNNVPYQVQELVERCWQEEYGNRPSMEQVGEKLLAIRNALTDEIRNKII